MTVPTANRPAVAASAQGVNAAAVAALGVVYGDLGTSPLYTLQTVMEALGGRATPDAALGVLSLILWTLVITISVKYCVFVMRADNHGEGGILALMSLVGVSRWEKGTYVFAAMGLLGAALIYGDGVITPAISVLSALEGVNVATDTLKPVVLPLAIAVLVGLFAVQRFGTSVIGAAFGPVMLLWFVVIGAIGAAGVLHHPGVIAAINPWLGIRLLASSWPTTGLLLGGVFLCATGGEALYADMGHFGPLPIRRAWYVVVLPCLFLSYAGQTGQLLDGVKPGVNPFFAAAPSWSLWPLVTLATLATIIASQAIITGAFSMTRQAMQLGWLPGFEIWQTSDRIYGQIYVPVVNVLMAAGTIAMTLAFRSSDRLAGAFGTAVSTTMVLTTLLLIRAMTRVWNWRPIVVVPLAVVFLAVDIGYFLANQSKILDGGWIPLVLGGCIFGIMVIWRTGAQSLRSRLTSESTPPDQFFALMALQQTVRVPGAAVYLTRATDDVPPFIVDYVRKMGSLHQTAISLHVEFDDRPRVEEAERISARPLGQGLWNVTLRYGFIEIPNVTRDLGRLSCFAAETESSTAIYFSTRDIIDGSEKTILDKIRFHIFSFLFKNAVRASDRFVLPPDRSFEFARHLTL